METISDYTIYCTPAQTRRAIELGVPIEKLVNHPIDKEICDKYHFLVIDGICYNNPTAEQMMGWLRKEHKIHTRIDCEGSENYVVQLQFINSSKDIDVENCSYKGIIGHKGYPSEPEAILAAIDAALEYLINNKK